MQNPVKVWRMLFALAIIAIAVQQLLFSVFMPVIIPWPADLSTSKLAVYTGSAVLILTSAFIFVDGKARPAAIYLGLIFLLLLIIFHIPNQFLNKPEFLGSWANSLKILTLSGCALIIASALPKGNYTTGFGGILPAGKYFLAITMLVFGAEHFIYADFVKNLVPKGLPGHLFWTYLTGAALIAAGLGIILNIKRRLAAQLLGIMILIWFVMLHIPRAMADPHSLNGNEIVSAFEALAFSCGAFTLAALSKTNVIPVTVKLKTKKG
ncbi:MULTISPECIES: DoxX family membrane protein [unclassified Mucilaginibacter]|uniref:DoxX family protein n=1 Tax=unclassified Mucilaginibacter TaxID=2617802 RepID=UPI002AC9160E|nr:MULTISPECIES: DoxX family membrane protein [unclassified Mucilaginibacter]MEB0261899.1 DoxX family membrane protein [Mucilaginibacter sp. 10I4]MEB0277628.1 DoxX family membrane protein [Mucilaginibacter sp. 10B2]MEB0299543.1 DoxX family membrane protein [Mucilaginibacter sp. 5C4]WPX24744.1 DoxX family membrane protein [Mucilaginibacter sp. 5C4]